MINLDHFLLQLNSFKSSKPFDHCVIDNFLPETLAEQLETEFPSYEYHKWLCYKNPLEDKKAIESWLEFPPVTYKLFYYLNSEKFVKLLSNKLNIELYPDTGLHGGGWHCYSDGGNLNPHLDYSIHPKLGLQRKLNLILYVSQHIKPEHGGYLGLWSHDYITNQPLRVETEIEPVFNRAVLFDTTQNSWHGFSRPLTPPVGVYRKSLAIYYLCDPPLNVDNRGRALFAPREYQKSDQNIIELIKLRSGIDTSKLVYKT